MLYYNQFEKFNPLTEYLPEYPFSYLPKLGWRARSLLSGCTLEKIIKIAQKVSDVIEGYYSDEKYYAIHQLESKFRNGEISEEEFEKFFYWDGGTLENGRWLFRDEMEEELDIPRENEDSEVDALKAILENRDSDFFNNDNVIEPPRNEYPEGKDYELFAVLGLWFIADALRNLGSDLKANSISGDYLLEAMDAVSYAEHLREKDWLISYSEVVKEKALNEALNEQAKQNLVWRELLNERYKKSIKEQKSSFARQGASARLANNPIEQAKNEIKKEYNNRKSQFKRRGYSAEFAREMQDKYPVITSIKTIERLIATLNKANEHIPR